MWHLTRMMRMCKGLDYGERQALSTKFLALVNSGGGGGVVRGAK